MYSRREPDVLLFKLLLHFGQLSGFDTIKFGVSDNDTLGQALAHSNIVLLEALYFFTQSSSAIFCKLAPVSQVLALLLGILAATTQSLGLSFCFFVAFTNGHTHGWFSLDWCFSLGSAHRLRCARRHSVVIFVGDRPE